MIAIIIGLILLVLIVYQIYPVISKPNTSEYFNKELKNQSLEESTSDIVDQNNSNILNDIKEKISNNVPSQEDNQPILSDHVKDVVLEKSNTKTKKYLQKREKKTLVSCNDKTLK